MKDLILIGFIASALILALRYPFVGLILWAWFTIMTPHQLAYGAFGIPLNTVIAGVTILSLIYHREFQRFRFDTITLMLLLLLGWQTLAQMLSLAPDDSAPYYDRFQKTLIFMLLCVQLASERLRFHALLWVIAGGLGLYGIKGGLFTLVNLGQYRVQGIPNTVLEDNNHFGIALVAVLPLMLHLRSQIAKPWLRQGMLVATGLSIIAILGTHSRGALLALLAFAGYFWWKSSHKIALGGLGAVMAIPLVVFMPSKWLERMKTITNATEDASFRGRLDAWEINFRLALENPLTGAGLRNAYNPDIAALAAPEMADRARAAHSIYFEMLGGSGFIGLAIFLGLLFLAGFSARRLEKLQGVIPPWKSQFGRYAKISLLGFCVGAASASMEMWDGYLLVIALVAAAQRDTNALKPVLNSPSARIRGKLQPAGIGG